MPLLDRPDLSASHHRQSNIKTLTAFA